MGAEPAAYLTTRLFERNLATTPKSVKSHSQEGAASMPCSRRQNSPDLCSCATTTQSVVHARSAAKGGSIRISFVPVPEIRHTPLF